MNAGSPPKWGVPAPLPPKEVFTTPWTVVSPGSSVHGILQARILDWIAVPSSRGSSQPRDRIQVSSIASRFFTTWATREAREDKPGSKHSYCMDFTHRKREKPASPQSNGFCFENKYCKSLMSGLPAQRRWIRIMLKSELESSSKFPDFRVSHLRLALSSTLQPPARVSVQMHRGAGMPNKWTSPSASVLALNPAIWSVSCYDVFTSRNMQTNFSHLSWPAHTRFPELEYCTHPMLNLSPYVMSATFPLYMRFCYFLKNYPLRSLREGKIAKTIGFRVQRNRIQTMVSIELCTFEQMT